MFSQAPGGMITTHMTRDSQHAVDIPMPEGTPVLAARGGVVAAAEWRHGTGLETAPAWLGGNLVRLRHADGTFATYAHLMPAGVAVELDEEIEAGRVIGYSGSTGFATGPHLHFGVTRLEPAGEGRAQVSVSVPVTFYVGDPPLAFAPRAALFVTADYSPRAEPPWLPSAPRRLPQWSPPVLAPEQRALAWGQLALWAAMGLAGIVWFYRFSRS